MSIGQQLAQANGQASVWRWVSVVLVATMLAGAPGYIELVRGSPSRSDLDTVRDRQQIVLQRLARIDVLIAELRSELQQHERTSKSH